MMLLTPILAGDGGDIVSTVLFLILKIIGVGAVIYLLARYIVPRIFSMVVKTKSKELFILTTVVFCFAIAWLTSSVGLSLALGAFFAGLIISESEYSHQATVNVLPFREIFISFFFISVGTLLNLEFFIQNILVILALVIGVVLLKMLVVGATVLLLKYPPRTIFLSLFSLFQVGEFSLLLSGVGLDNNIIPDSIYQYFLAISIITMGLTPFLIAAAPKITYSILKSRIPASVRHRLESFNKQKSTEESSNEPKKLEDHLIIIGYGINGENIAKAARNAEIPYVIVDTDPVTFRKAKNNNEPVIFGDATNSLILKHLHVQEARVVVIAISDPGATKKIISNVRLYTKTAFIIVRTRYVREIEENIKLGADEVIPEEFETSIEIFNRVLKKYLVPYNEIMDFTASIRSSDYEMLTSVKGRPHKPSLQHLHIPNREIVTLSVQQNNRAIVGKSIQNSGIGKNFRVTVLAIKRDTQYITEILPGTKIKQGDLLYIFGNPVNINRLNEELSY